MNEHHNHSPSDLERILSETTPREADRLREVWERIGADTPADVPNPEAVAHVWEALEAFVESSDQQPPAAPRDRAGASRMRRSTFRPWMALAATVLLGAAIGVLAWWTQPVVRTAAPGQRLAVTLPDGSLVELNSGSTLRHARRFGAERVVHLAGEAFFDVAEEERPFTVETFNARVRVLGTRFNVRAWQQSIAPGTSVTVASGRVALAPADRPDRVVTLASGQAHRIAREAYAPTMPDTATIAQATAWRTGDLVYKGEWLGIILEDIERRFVIKVTVHPPALLTTDVTLASRNPTDAESVIRDLCIALRLNYRATSGGYEIYQTTKRVEPGDSI